MKVLLSIHHPLDPDAGAAGVVWHVGDAIARLGHEVEYFSWDDLPDGLPARAKELLFPEFAARRFAVATREGFDVIEASTGDAWLWGRMRRGAGPLLATRSQGLEHRFRRARLARGGGRGVLERLYHDRLRLREVRASLRASDVTLYGNAADRAEAVERFGLDPAHAHVIANGIAEDLLGLEPPVASDTAQVTMAQLGTFDARKGSDVVITALTEVLARRPDARMLMLGTGVEPTAVLGRLPPELRSQVACVPRYRRNELPRLLADAEILIHPSLAEGFSLALLEGIACGLAPIATTAGSAPDLIEHGGPGILVAAGDPRELADAMLTLIDDPARRYTLRRAAHHLAQRYTWRAAAEATLGAYRGALEAFPGRRPIR